MKRYLIAPILFLVAQMVFSQTAFVSGKIESWCGYAVSGVTVTATNSAGETTIAISETDGTYLLELEEGENYTIAPYSNHAPVNGVSTFDFVLISSHMTGSQPFTAPYQIIAADVNNSGTVSPMDLLDIRSAIMFVTNGLPNNISWRFFHNMLESHALNNLSGDVVDLDWVAVKIGDVNCSASGVTEPDPSFLAPISGQAYEDQNGNCLFDPGEPTLANWDVSASSSTATFIGHTQEDGSYLLLVPEGMYDITVFPPNELWSVCNPLLNNVEVNFPSSTSYDFGGTALTECPWMTVDMSTTFLRRCFENTYYVQYCNQGTEEAIGAEVVIEFDAFFENFSSSIPWSSVNGNTYTFPLGDVPVGECGAFTVNFEVSCDAELDQTHCSTAHIYPDSLCVPTPNWSGADLDVTGECVGDEIIFTLTNNGEDMTEAVDFVVIEDVMIQLQATTSILAAGQSEQIPMPGPVANGATWRIMVDESAGHPYDLLNTVAVEGCGGFTPGFVTQFPEGDEEHYVDIDCQQNLGSWDPNDKQGLPLGIHDEHFIEEGQDIEYRIRFQNTGTDTAFTVAIFDTLDADLDWSSIELGASSHDFRYNMYPNGIMAFYFDNIMLPDSNVNEPASHGFVKYKVKQRPGLPVGTEIENEASIFFDFNAPVVTNRTRHTIGKDFLEITSTEVLVPNVKLDVFPNPFESVVNLQLHGMSTKNGTLILFNQIGRTIDEQKFVGNEIRYDGRMLSPGLYFFKIMADGKTIASGKLMK